jgi:hypothetical protein
MQKETEKSAIEIVKSKIPAQLRVLFCEPLFLEVKDRESYWGLVAALIAEQGPKTAPDWIAINDMVTKLWEERALRRASNALVRREMIERLGWLLVQEEDEPKYGPPSFSLRPLDEEAQMRARSALARRRIKSYFGDNSEQEEKIAALVARFGLTESELYAQVFKENSKALQEIEVMLARRERDRRRLRKEDRRRLREERRADVEGAGVRRRSA